MQPSKAAARWQAGQGRAVREESEVPDAHEAAWQNMLRKAAQKLGR